ncbi:MAG TPA: hypothetical protein VIM11_27620 [Tepidisphaeraceae bacterium]|jgi:hypothetical protein
MPNRFAAMVLALLVSPLVTIACMRPTMDERAVQWSSAIVEAKLLSAGPEIKLGEIQERRGALGTLGVATISYSYRLYTFSVTRALDGALKPGDKLPIIRLFSKADEPPLSSNNAPPQPNLDPCVQILDPKTVGKEFLVMARLLSEFKAVVPNGVTMPDIKGAMWVVHVEPKESLKPATLEELTTTISNVRDTERQIDPARVDRLLTQIQSAPSDDRAGPSIRALERLGPKILPTVQQAATKTSGPARTRLLQVVSDLMPPEPINMIEVVKVEPK